MASRPHSHAGTLSQRVASYVHTLRFDDLPAEVIEKAKRLVCYNIGQGLRGYDTDDGRQARQIAAGLSGAAGSATVIGSTQKLQPLDAAFANCSMMRAYFMDDVLFPAGIHAGLVTLPGGLALAEARGLSGRELLAALVAGYEVMSRLARGIASWDAATPRRPTIPFGPFGGAVVAGKLLRLDPVRLTNAIGYAAHSAMGLAEDPWTHYYSLVARNGMMSALLAEADGETSPTILEAEYGYFRTFFGGVPGSIHEALDSLGTEHHIFGATSKRYPGTGANIPPIEITRELVHSRGLTADKVERVDVTLPATQRNFAASTSKGPFTSSTKAASSMPYQLSMVIVDGETNHARYEHFASPEMADVVRRIHVTFDPGFESRARVEVTCYDGSRHTLEAARQPFPDLDWLDALNAGAGHGVPGERIERAAHLLAHLESVAEVSELMECLTPAA
jgi:2-methylcitrate dehydratase PrpD